MTYAEARKKSEMRNPKCEYYAWPAAFGFRTSSFRFHSSFTAVLRHLFAILTAPSARCHKHKHRQHPATAAAASGAAAFVLGSARNLGDSMWRSPARVYLHRDLVAQSRSSAGCGASGGASARGVGIATKPSRRRRFVEPRIANPTPLLHSGL